uniref:Elongator complex protein 2 n=2 Tax=Photinus pyralis TaxID=7054 RepID=A0A1Y1LNG0_PHOPY
MSVEVCYTSCSSNQTPTCVNWGKNNLICFASCNSIRIYDPWWGSGGKILNTLCGHTQRVNSVKWIAGPRCETELVSGSSDGNAIVWSLKGDDYVSFVLRGHESNVNIVDCLYRDSECKAAVIATASLDSTVKVWTRSNVDGDFELKQNLVFGYGIAMAMRIAFLPATTTLVMACGMDNSNIQLYVEDNDRFCESEVLRGHENWVRGLDFTVDDRGDLILASSSQDSLIRLWRFSHVSTKPSADEYELILKKSRVKTSNYDCVISLESILAGHESWVYSVNWNVKDFTVLSASLDKSMIIWGYDANSGLWLEKVRVGEVGGNTLGFYGGMFGPNGDTILAHGYHGAFHIWSCSKEGDSWDPVVTVNGHFNEVADLGWEPQGEFLLSVSTDQTTRIHAPWTFGDKITTWHEISRPQVHGYDLSCIAVLSRYKFASGAEEKIVRSFKAPKNFVQNFCRICHIDDSYEESATVEPKGAAVPSLGLSNKAVYEDDNADQATAKTTKEPYPEESYFKAVDLAEPPTEETLLQNTLWPEIQKLYGHGYEIYSLAASPDGVLLASACKSTTKEHAAILIWDTSTWTQLQKLYSHTLTIVQLAFSPDSKHLLSVSRDRRWSIFTRDTDTNTFQLKGTTDKKTGIHTRIIWCCAWSHDSQYFATGSRDGKVVIWGRNPDKPPEDVLGQYEAVGHVLEFKGESVTALAFAPVTVEGSYLVGVGFESGIIKLYQWNVKGWELFSILDNRSAHHLTVRRLSFRPVVGEAGSKVRNNRLQLASCGSDYTLRIYTINVNDT